MVRPDKVAVVEEIGEKLSSSTAAVLTEYRGLSVPELANLRAALREANTQYKVYKNTLARRAVEGQHDELVELLEGPVAWAFVDGDVVTAAKAIREFSKGNESLVVKGGLLEGAFISAEQVDELAQLPTRDELLARLAGGFKAPLAKAAGLFSALQRNTAYAIKALIEKREEAGEVAEAPPDQGEDQAAADDAPAEEAAGEAADEKPEGTASPEAESEADAQEEESGAEAGDSEDDSGAEAADDGSSADESAEDVSSDAAEASAEDEEAAGDDAQEPEADEDQ